MGPLLEQFMLLTAEFPLQTQKVSPHLLKHTRGLGGIDTLISHSNLPFMELLYDTGKGIEKLSKS